MVPYTFEREAVRTRVVRPPVRNAAAVSAVIVSLDGKVLPLVTATVEIAEQVRRRLMGIHAKIEGSRGTRLVEIQRQDRGRAAAQRASAPVHSAAGE